MGGMKGRVGGNFLFGFGFSFFVSFELVVFVFLNEVYFFKFFWFDMVFFVKKVENEFVGVFCGIFD